MFDVKKQCSVIRCTTLYTGTGSKPKDAFMTTARDLRSWERREIEEAKFDLCRERNDKSALHCSLPELIASPHFVDCCEKSAKTFL